MTEETSDTIANDNETVPKIQGGLHIKYRPLLRHVVQLSNCHVGNFYV